jgi:LysM repeat protein
MNNPNPFVPQGSLLEQQSKRRSRLKLGVLCVLAVGIAGLAVMLIQGCKREESETDNNQPTVDTNAVSTVDTNMAPPNEASNLPPTGTVPPPQPPPQAVTPPPPAPPTETEYVVVKGDYYAKIAKQYGITVKALEDANPNIPATKLKVGEKLVIPAGASTTGANTAGETANGIADANGEEVYVVKSGDVLMRIAKHYGVTVKEIQAANNMSTTRINVGQKLKIPAKPEAGPAPVNAPPTTAAPEPVPQGNPPPAPSANPPVQTGQPGGQQQ